MNKRIGAALTVACLTLTLAVPAFAADPASTAQAVQVVNALGIMVGDENGDMHLASPVTRAEFITMAVKATPGGEQIGQAATSPYPDVSWKHWASGYVEAGVAAGLISGYTDGTFRPNNRITLAEGVTIVLQLLGYGPADFSGAYPTGQLAMYRSLKLDRGVAAQTASAQLTRQDAMYLFYNLMTAKTKEGTPYLNTLGHSLNASGEIDLVSLVNGSMEGPVVVESGWQEKLPVDLNRAKVYRNGGASQLSALQELDVVYWNSSMGTVWAYSDKVTGTIQALEPSASAPTSVTVAGRICQIETSAAAFALSSLGQYGLGDTVTLLLGRDGGVAAVAEPVAAADSQRVGLITSVTNDAYPDGKGGTYTARTAAVLSTDGQTYRYPVQDRGIEAGDLVRVTLSGRGVELKSLPSASLSGKVDGAGTKVGRYSFASGAEILDISGVQGVRVYPSRLAGITLSDSMVKYYSLDGEGKVDKLVLKDVTGDMHQYGILTNLTGVAAGEFSTYYTYELDLGGRTVTVPQTTTRFPVEEGPVQVKGPAEAPEKIYALNAAQKGELSGSQFLADRKTYTLSDDVVVYERRSGNYYLSSLARVREGSFTFTGWYDKTDANGGRVRVIVAQEK